MRPQDARRDSLEDNAKAFFDSLFDDLEPDDRAALIRDWTEHGVIIIENVGGNPVRRNPEDTEER
jgi:hypothetical protein